ncbi:hypothetical protein MC885_009834 [Smutsia gigantea]|nr:hypothetical protein MC885_009834 [Smutsia gigantea]
MKCQCLQTPLQKPLLSSPLGDWSLDSRQGQAELPQLGPEKGGQVTRPPAPKHTGCCWTLGREVPPPL